MTIYILIYSELSVIKIYHFEVTKNVQIFLTDVLSKQQICNTSGRYALP